MNLQRPQGADDARLKSIVGVCGVGFLVVTLLLLLIQRTALPGELIGACLVLAVLAIYAIVGVISWTARLAEYFCAGERIPAVFAGIAAGAEWLGPAMILGATGSLFLASHDGHALVLALAAGYVLAAVLIAPFLGNLRATTLPDFVGKRFGSTARVVAIIVLIACASLLAVALIQAAAATMARGLGLDTGLTLYLVVGMIALCTIPGGMRGVTATQVAQYVVLVIGAFALFVMIEAERFDVPAGENYDALVLALRAIARGTGLAPSLSPRSIPFTMTNATGNLEFVLCLMAGTAAMPHILMRSATTAGAAQSRTSIAWSLLFIAVLVFTLPTFFALTADEAERDRGVLHGLIVVISLSAMLAAASNVMLTLANSLGHDLCHKALAPGASPAIQILLARVTLAVALLLVAYGAASLPPEPLSMAAWSFSLAAAGFFPVLVLGIWWQRTTTVAAVCGMAAGFAVTLFYLVVTRYFPQAGVTQFGMMALLDPANGRPLVDAAQAFADPRWLADVPASTANPLASKVGWLNIGNLACGILGMPIGFLIIIVLSLIGKQPSPKRQAAIAALRVPTNARTQHEPLEAVARRSISGGRR
jgi:cation/acetate symporter